MSDKRPRKYYRLKQAAELLGCSAESIRNGSFAFKLRKQNCERATSPWLVEVREVDAFLERRERAERRE